MVTPALFARASTPTAMAQLAASRDPARSSARAASRRPRRRHIRRALADPRRAHGGRCRDDFEALEALPGVGHKTASVVMAQAFGQPAFPVDTHIHRLAARWGLSSGTERRADRARPEDALPARAWNTLHLQIIYFGREYCPARGHDLAALPDLLVGGVRGPGPLAERAPVGAGRPAARPASARSHAAHPPAAHPPAAGSPAAARSMITGLDHVVIAVRDLDAAVRAYEAPSRPRAVLAGRGRRAAVQRSPASASITWPWS